MTIPTAGNVSGVDQAELFASPGNAESRALRQLQALRQRVMSGGDAARRRTGALPQDMFQEAKDEMSKQLADQEASRRAAAQERLSRIRQSIEARAVWKSSAFADRIAVLLGALEGQGEHCEGVRICIISGAETAIEHNKLTEAVVVHWENVAKGALAHASRQDRMALAPWTPISGADILKQEPGLEHLHPELINAAVRRVNDVGPQLAALGYTDVRSVNSACPMAARAVASRIKDFWLCLVLVEESRRARRRNPKRHNAAHLEKLERHASELLGIDTLSYPFLCMA